MTRYFGKVCTKHPELNGERMKSNGTCIKCKNEARAQQHIINKEHEKAKYAEWYARSGGKPSRKLEETIKAERESNRVRMAAYRAGGKYRSNLHRHVRERTPAWADRAKIDAIYAEARSKGLTVDHIIPLRGKLVSGLHVHNNLQLSPASVNFSKGNKFIGV